MAIDLAEKENADSSLLLIRTGIAWEWQFERKMAR